MICLYHILAFMDLENDELKVKTTNIVFKYHSDLSKEQTGQSGFNYLAILAIDSELAKTLDFSDVIYHFSQRKAGKTI